MSMETTMAVTPKRRHSLRIHLETQLVASMSGARNGSATVRDLGLGGAFLETKLPFEVGDSLHVKILSGSPPFQCPSKVRNVMADGIGIEFVQMKPEDRELLRRLITNLLG